MRHPAFTPGVYSSHVLAHHFDIDTTRVWAFQVPTTALTKQSTLPPPPPATINGFDALQYRQNVLLLGVGSTVDLNAAEPHALAS